MLLTALSECCGKPVEDIRPMFNRDFFMSAEEAEAFGIVDGTCSAADVAAFL
jgi:ATP-dependent protease ClpP protease subunit